MSEEIERTEKIVEELAGVLIGVEAIIDIGLETRVDVAVIQFTVKDQKDLVCANVSDRTSVEYKTKLYRCVLTIGDEGSNDLCFWPFCLGIELLCEASPSTFIRSCYLREVII